MLTDRRQMDKKRGIKLKTPTLRIQSGFFPPGWCEVAVLSRDPLSLTTGSVCKDGRAS